MDRNEVINKVFPHSLIGYDPVAVDAFLDEVIREFDRMTNTIDVLQFRLAQELGEVVDAEALPEPEGEAAGRAVLPAPQNAAPSEQPQDPDED